VLLFGVLPGIGIGVLVSLLEVLRRTVLPPTAVLGQLSGSPTWRNVEEYDGARLLPGLLVYRFDAPLFFANAEVFASELTELVDDSDPAVTAVLVNAEGIIDLDVTGADVLAKVVFEMRERGVRVMFARMRSPVLRTLSRLDLVDKFGADAFYLRMEDAVAALDPRPA
jgi:SulP family sulfate permease